MSDTFAWPAFGAGDLHDASESVEALRAQARAEGYAAGNAQAQQETAQLHRTLRESLGALAAAAGRLEAAEAEGITALVIEATRKLLLVELRTNPDVLRALVGEALDVLNADLGSVVVLMNPEDHALFSGSDAPGSGAAAAEAQVPLDGLTLRPDPSVPLGGVSVRWERQSVEFDPLGRLDGFAQEEVAGDARSGTASGPV